MIGSFLSSINSRLSLLRPSTTTTTSIFGTNSLGTNSGVQILSQSRGIRGQFGSEYQPSVTKRKNKHGFMSRLKTRGGKAMLARRLLKGRKSMAV